MSLNEEKNNKFLISDEEDNISTSSSGAVSLQLNTKLGQTEQDELAKIIKSLDQNDSINLNESLNESQSESDSYAKQVVLTTAESVLNESLNDSSNLEINKVSAELNESLNVSTSSVEEEKKTINLTQIVGDILTPISNLLGFTEKLENKNDESATLHEVDNLNKSQTDSISEQKEPSQEQEATVGSLTDIMKIVTGLALIGSEAENDAQSHQNEESNPESLNTTADTSSFHIEEIEKVEIRQELAEISLQEQSEEQQSVQESLNSSVLSQPEALNNESKIELESSSKAPEQSIDKDDFEHVEKSETSEVNVQEQNANISTTSSSDDSEKVEIKQTNVKPEPEKESTQQQEPQSEQKTPPVSLETSIASSEQEQSSTSSESEKISESQEQQHDISTSENQASLDTTSEDVELERIEKVQVSNNQAEQQIETIELAPRVSSPCLAHEVITCIGLVQTQSEEAELDSKISEACVLLESKVCEPLFINDEILNKKEDYLTQYKISDEQFQLVWEFYTEKKDGLYLDNSLLRLLMNEALKERSQVKANEDDVKRALETVDENKDDKITFDEFLRLLLLFFSSKNNLARRISNVLKAKLTNENLSSQEAIEFSNFLNRFFGKSDSELQFNDGLDVKEFVNEVTPALEQSAFVQEQSEEKQEQNEEKKEQSEEKKEQSEEKKEQNEEKKEQNEEKKEQNEEKSE